MVPVTPNLKSYILSASTYDKYPQDKFRPIFLSISDCSIVVPLSSSFFIANYVKYPFILSYEI